MKSYIINSNNQIELIEKEIPSIGNQQVLLKMYATSLNFRDLLTVEGSYGGKGSTGTIPLSDGVGVIEKIGSEVKKFQIGERVCPTFMPGWIDGTYTKEKARSALGAGEVQGVLSEYIAIDESALVKVPEYLSNEEAATLPCAAVTAWFSLFVSHQLQPGHIVLLLGTGGVSIFALQLAKTAGATVIITSSNDEKLAQAKKLGADFIINYSKTPDWDEEVLRLTNQNGVDIVVEVGGANTLNKSLNAVKYSGTVSMIGVLTGKESNVTTGKILSKKIKVEGVYVGSRKMFEDMNLAFQQNQIRPQIDKVFSFLEAPQAFEYLKSGKHFGKVVVSISERGQ
jgi:NADPH:quinone reductase-like Zn-dependent oxidoreductase